MDRYPCPPETYCAECDFYLDGVCLHALVKDHKEQEEYHRKIRQKYEADIRNIIHRYAVKQEELK